MKRPLLGIAGVLFGTLSLFVATDVIAYYLGWREYQYFVRDNVYQTFAKLVEFSFVAVFVSVVAFGGLFGIGWGIIKIVRR